MMVVIAGALTLVLVVGFGLAIGIGGVGDLVARLNPAVKLAGFGVVLLLVAAAGWTLGSLAGPIGDRPGPSAPAVVPESGHGEGGHGG